MFFGSSKPRAKKFRYKVTVKGTQISRHYTKKSATKAASRIRGARVVAIGKRYTKKRTYSKRRRY